MFLDVREKKCRICKETKEISEFHKDKSNKSGFRNECKLCAKERSKIAHQKRMMDKEWVQKKRDKYKEYYNKKKQDKEWVERERKRQRDQLKKENSKETRRKYRHSAKGREVHKTSKKNALMTIEGKIKNRAQQKAWRYARKGLIKKEPCESCGSKNNIHAHHDDYSKPLEVKWFCHKCHMEYHRLNPQTGIISELQR